MGSGKRSGCCQGFQAHQDLQQRVLYWTHTSFPRGELYHLHKCTTKIPIFIDLIALYSETKILGSNAEDIKKVENTGLEPVTSTMPL